MNLVSTRMKCYILMGALIMVSLLFPGVSAGSNASYVHPYLLFHNIADTPGYQNSALAPWKAWQTNLIGCANSELKLDYSSPITPAWGTYPPTGHLNNQPEGSLGGYNRIIYRAQYAEDMALTYQITKDTRYSNKTQDILLNDMNIGSNGTDADFGMALGSYSLAYDWIQPTLSKVNDTRIRDNLATFADFTYKQAAQMEIDYPDFEGHTYPELGVASAALRDYTNPNGLALQSNASEWYNVGTKYLFENDALHPAIGRSMFSTAYDSTGKELSGAYKSYGDNDLALWYQVCNNTYGVNLLNKYPIAKNAMLSETWESIPLNDLANDYDTNGITGWIDQVGSLNLLSDTDKAIALNHIDRVQSQTVGDYSTILPLSGIWSSPIIGTINHDLLYCVYQGEYPTITRSFPINTSHLDPAGNYQVFRNSWSNDSDWMSLVTWNYKTYTNRNMDHQDQLGFEYYSRGDLLLADGGEVKHILDTPYGYYDVFHNTISLENPRTAFPVQPWSGSTSAGILKGDKNTNLITPATIGSIIQVPWMQLMKTNITITQVNTQGLGAGTKLSSPIQYERTIMYPVSDYFIVIDRLQGTEPWIYRNIFRPSSLMVTPTTNTTDASKTGHVNGTLTIGSTPIDWQGLTYKKETDTGINTSSLIWNTQNPYGKKVTLNLVTSPSSQVLVEKNVGRIGGYTQQSEVYNPIVWFRSPASTSSYRVTVLLSSYANEPAKTADELVVKGTGHALNVNGSGFQDFIYTGSGSSVFGPFATDADTAYIRESGTSVTNYTIIDGSYLNTTSGAIVSASQQMAYLSAHQDSKTINFEVSGQGSADIFFSGVYANAVMKDGTIYNSWSMQNGSILKISTDLNKHDFQVALGSSLKINPITGANVTEGTLLTFPVTSVYTGNGILTYSAANLPANATFSASNGTFNWLPLSNQIGTYNVTFTVTDGQLSSQTTAKITVVSIPANSPPVISAIPDKSVSAGNLLTFSVIATDPDGYSLTYSAANLPANATFSASNGTFNWLPLSNQIGSYNVTFTATDGQLSSQTTAKITVVSTPANNPPVIASIPDKSVSTGNLLTFSVTATDPYGYALTYAANNLPANATFNTTTGAFSWVPSITQIGTYNVILKVTDHHLSSQTTAKITVVSTPANNPPVIASIPDKSVSTGNLLTFPVTATDPYGYALTYSAANLPANATFNTATGAFSWIPASSQTGTFNVVFTVTDGQLSSQTTAKITVVSPPANSPPVIEPVPDKSVSAGNLLTFPVTATDPYGYALTYAANNLPANATFNTATGAFSWIPSSSQIGTYDVILKVTDHHLSSSTDVKITVMTGN
jgi:hypothetical protein